MQSPVAYFDTGQVTRFNAHDSQPIVPMVKHSVKDISVNKYLLKA